MSLKLPPKLLHRGLGPLPLVPLVSAHVEVDPSCRYLGLPHFSHFQDTIRFVGGVNKPKLVRVRPLSASHTRTCPLAAPGQ